MHARCKIQSAEIQCICLGKEALELSREQLETLSNTISERSASEKNPALQSDIRKLVDILCIQTKAGA